MRIITDLEQIGSLPEKTAVAIGKFDGLHKGHRLLLDKLIALKAMGRTTVVFTFAQNPRMVTDPKRRLMLLTRAERQKMLEDMGVDWLIECPFTPDIRCMMPPDFVRGLLCRRLNMADVVVGEDFCFGFERSGDLSYLMAHQDIFGYRCHPVLKLKWKNEVISSTRVRRELELGHMEEAEAMLGYPYTISGRVAYGRQKGRTIGYPTINMSVGQEKLLPPMGVYLSLTALNGRQVLGMSNIGVRPTVSDEGVPGLETYLMDLCPGEKDLYGRDLSVALHSFIRPERRFDSLQALGDQLKEDEAKIRQMGKSFMDA